MTIALTSDLFLLLTLFPHYIFWSESTIDTNHEHLSNIQCLNSHQDWKGDNDENLIVPSLSRDFKEEKARKIFVVLGGIQTRDLELHIIRRRATLQSRVVPAFSAPWCSGCMVGPDDAVAFFSIARVQTQPAIVSIHPYNAVPLLGLLLIAGEPGALQDNLLTAFLISAA